jgi:hypothetical protein
MRRSAAPLALLFLTVAAVPSATAIHRTSFMRVGLRVPVVGEFGVGADLGILGRNSRYELPATSLRMSRMRIYLIGPSS